MKVVCVDGPERGTVVNLQPGDWVFCFATPYGLGDLVEDYFTLPPVITYHRRTYWPGVPFAPVDVLVQSTHPNMSWVEHTLDTFWAMRTLDDS